MEKAIAYLEVVVGNSANKITKRIELPHMSTAKALKEIGEFLRTNGQEPGLPNVLILYIGHGNKDTGNWPTRTSFITHTDITKCITRNFPEGGAIDLMIDCCYGESWIFQHRASPRSYQIYAQYATDGGVLFDSDHYLAERFTVMGPNNQGKRWIDFTQAPKADRPIQTVYPNQTKLFITAYVGLEAVLNKRRNPPTHTRSLKKIHAKEKKLRTRLELIAQETNVVSR